MRTPAKILLGIILAAGIFFAGYIANRKPVSVVPSTSGKQAASYSCPMHPQYTSDHPGDCPICGMRLVATAAVNGARASDSASPDVPGVVAVGAARQQLIGLRTVEVRRDSSSHLLRVPGRIAVDDQRLYRIVAAVDGWIVELGQNTVGRSVKKDQFLASYYTRDLLSTERLFLLSIPAVVASGLFEMYRARHDLGNIGLVPLALSTIVAGIVGYATIAFLLKYLKTHTTFVFIWYRIALGAILWILLLLNVVAS